MKIAILLYDGFTALDAIGPYEILSRLPNARLSFVAEDKGAVTTDTTSSRSSPRRHSTNSPNLTSWSSRGACRARSTPPRTRQSESGSNTLTPAHDGRRRCAPDH